MATNTTRLRGDEAQLYRQHHRHLIRTVARAVHATDETIQDACQTAWLRLLTYQPDRDTAFAWLRVVAIREVYDICKADRGQVRFEDLDLVGDDWQDVLPSNTSVERTVEARRGLQVLAELPPRQRDDLALRVAGFGYVEIARMTGNRTVTHVNRYLVDARARIRAAENSC